jgi:hypothetical protein
MKAKILTVMLVMSCTAAWADNPPADKIPAELRSCLAIERNTERLSCFDRGVAAILKGEGAVAPTAESSFGMVASTTRADVERGDAGDEVMSVKGKVTALKTLNGDELITLDNGQIWRQLSGGQLLLKLGDEVQISRAVLGSFQMKVPTGRSAKVKRLR